MADKKISELNPLNEPDIAPGDVAAVADLSANQTKKVTVPAMAEAGIRLMPDEVIPGNKLEPDSISNDKIVASVFYRPQVAWRNVASRPNQTEAFHFKT